MKLLSDRSQIEPLKIGNVTFRSFYDDRLTEDDMKQAWLELGETEEKKAVSLFKLKESLIRDEDFSYRLDDEYLLRFLRYRKYDVDKAYTTIRKFYAYRKERADLFRVPSNLEFLLTRNLALCLPHRDEQGSPIFFIDTNKWKLEEMNIDDIMLLTHAISDVATMHPSMQINGIVSIWDVEGLTARHIAQYAFPSVISTFLRSMQSFYPWRIKRVIAVNCNVILRGLYNVFRPLLSKKIADRVILLGSDYSEIHRYMNPRILPKKLGGHIETTESNFTQLVLDNVPYIKYERSFGINTNS